MSEGPREFWIEDKETIQTFVYTEEELTTFGADRSCKYHHVIEKSALDQANARIKELEERGERLASWCEWMIENRYAGPGKTKDKMSQALREYRGESKEMKHD